MRKRQELENVKNFIDSTYNHWGNRLVVNTDKEYDPGHSQLGYCYKYIDPVSGNIVYNINCCKIGIERTDFRIMMHEYGHIYKGHMDEEYEELDTQICNVFRDHRMEIIELIVKETGLDEKTAEKLIERVIDDPEVNHSLHNIAMDMEVNSTILSKEDMEEMEWDITSILPKYEEEMLKKSIEHAQDEEYKKKLNEAYEKMLSEVKIKFILPCRYNMGTDDQGNPIPFPDGLKYVDYLLLIIKHIDQFVKMMVSIKMGGNGDTSNISQDDIQAALNGMLNQMRQRFQNQQSEAYREGYRQAIRDAREGKNQQQNSSQQQMSEEFKKGFQDGFKQQLGQLCGTEDYKNGYQDGFDDEQSNEGQSQDYKDGFQEGQSDGKSGQDSKGQQKDKTGDYNQGYQDGYQKGQERQERDAKDGQSEGEKQSSEKDYNSGYQDGKQAAQNQQQFGPQGNSKDQSQEESQDSGQGSQQSGQESQEGSGNDYQDGFQAGQQQAQNMANQGQQGQSQQGQGNQQGQGQGQQDGTGSGSGQSQEMSDYNQGYQDAMNDLANSQANGGMQGLSDLMQQMGITQGQSNLADPGYHNKVDPGQKKGEGQDQKDTLNPYEGLGRCQDHGMDHKSDSRDQADEKRKEGKIQAGGGVGCGKSGTGGVTREVDKCADEVDMAMGEVINDIRHRVVKQTLQRDVMKNYNRGVTRSVIAPSISRKISVSTNPKIVFLLDVSGSMDTRLIDRILKTIAKSIKKINRDLRYDIIAWDTQLCEHYRDIDPKKSIPRISCGGGTDMAGGMEYFKKNYGPEAILVLISDFCDSLDEWHRVELTMKNYSMWGFNYGDNRYSYKRGDWDWKYFKQRNFSNYGYDD